MSIEQKVANMINKEIILEIKKLWNEEFSWLVWNYSGQVINDAAAHLLSRFDVPKMLLIDEN